MKKCDPWKAMLRRKDPDRLFDMIVAGNYFAGQFDGDMPVEQSRKAFARIKKLLRDAAPEGAAE